MKFRAKILSLFLSAIIFFIGLPQLANASSGGQIWINSETNQIQGWGWMEGANVLVTVGADEFPIAAGEFGNFVMSFTGTGYDIEPGTIVSASHLDYTTSHTVTELAFDVDVDYPEGTIAKGTATPGSQVSLYLSGFGRGGREWWFDGEPVTVTADETTGEWQHDFSDVLDVNDNKFEWLDLHAFQPNKETSSTFVVRTSDPGSIILGVSPQINTIWGHGWSYGELTITLQRGTQKFTYDHGIHYGGDYRLHYDNHGLNIEKGDVVTAQIGDLIMTHEVIDVNITSIDVENNIIKGLAKPNDEVTVQITNGGYFDVENMRVVSTNSSGVWTADFSIFVNYEFGSYSAFDIKDDTEIWVHQNISVEGTPFDFSEGRTIITNQTNLVALVRSLLTTKMAEFSYLRSNISEVLNDESQDLVFEAENLGKIGFSSFYFDLLLSIDPELLENLENLIKIVYDSENGTISTKVDTSALSFLAGHSATIEFYNVAKSLGIDNLSTENIRDFLNITVYDGDNLVEDISQYFDWDNIVYNPETDILILPVNHFTEYVLGAVSLTEEEELAQTGVVVALGIFSGITTLLGATLIKKYQKS